MAIGGKNASLLFGIQWDLACKFLENKNALTVAQINADSTNWGNYSNNAIALARGKYLNGANVWTAFNTDDTANGYVTGSKTVANKRVFLTTGASNVTNKMNIHDLAGNVCEWTLEHATSLTSYPCAYRGGGFLPYRL